MITNVPEWVGMFARIQKWKWISFGVALAVSVNDYTIINKQFTYLNWYYPEKTEH